MKKKISLADSYLNLLRIAGKSNDGYRCMVAPNPDLKKKLKKDFKALQDQLGNSTLRTLIKPERKKRLGLNDAMIVPGDVFPLGTSPGMARGLSQKSRGQLTGVLRVVVVMIEFSDKKMVKKKKHFEDLFFSKGVVSTGSVAEYYNEVSNGKVRIQGEVVGPIMMPLSLRKYANNGGGMDNDSPNARDMCYDAAKLADGLIDFAKYDNDKDGYVDAFVVVHAGRGAEETGDNYDIWSHKWLFPKVYKTDTTKVYSYLTVPEDCSLGVCAHELGHLLFGFPDLYDGDYTSEGLGEFCLMASGSWNNKGKTPAHPCGWCKVQQNWVETVVVNTTIKNATIDDVKKSKKVYKLWKDGNDSNEYFLVENRMKTSYDKFIPGEGLLIYHVDDSIDGNDDEQHYQVALVQADAKNDLEKGRNQGGASDTWPGKLRKTSFNKNTKPNSLSYGSVDTKVAIENIQLKTGKIKANLIVSEAPFVSPSKPLIPKRLTRGIR